MAVISLNIPDNRLDRVIDSICAIGGYRSGDKNTFVQRYIIERVMEIVVAHEAGGAAKTAGETAKATVLSEITIT